MKKEKRKKEKKKKRKVKMERDEGQWKSEGPAPKKLSTNKICKSNKIVIKKNKK